MHKYDVKLTGLYLSVLLLAPFLNNGVMFASSHCDVMIPSLSDKLKNIANGVLIWSMISLSSFCGIPSTQGDLFSVIILMFFDIMSGVTKNALIDLIRQPQIS